MGSTTFARGPGGQEFFSSLGDVWMVYHGWARGQAGRAGAERRLYLDIVEFRDGVPTRVGGRRTATVFVIGSALVLASAGALVWWWRRRRRAGLRTDERA